MEQETTETTTSDNAVTNEAAKIQAQARAIRELLAENHSRQASAKALHAEIDALREELRVLRGRYESLLIKLDCLTNEAQL